MLRSLLSPPPRTPIAALLLAGALAACGEAPALRVGPVSFTERDLAGLGDDQIERLALVTAVGLAVRDGDPARVVAPVIEAQLARERVALLRREVVLEAAGIGETVLRARYRTNPEPELVVRHLLIRADRGEARATREAARARAEEARARALAGESFPDLAAEVSEEPGAAGRGGLLEPGREGSWVPEFQDAALALEEGEVSPVVETRYGYHVLRLEERRTVPFEEARDRVADEVARLVDRGEAWDEAVTAYTDGLTVHPEAAAAFRPGAPDSAVVLASWPGGELGASELDRVLRGLPPGRREAVREGPDDVRIAEIRRVAEGRILLAEARDRGIAVPDGTAEGIREEWTRTVLRWGAVLGIAEATTPDELREAALAALGATGQEARVARAEMERWAPAILAVWPVERP